MYATNENIQQIIHSSYPPIYGNWGIQISGASGLEDCKAIEIMAKQFTDHVITRNMATQELHPLQYMFLEQAIVILDEAHAIPGHSISQLTTIMRENRYQVLFIYLTKQSGYYPLKPFIENRMPQLEWNNLTA